MSGGSINIDRNCIGCLGAAVFKNMRIFPVYTITFNPPFSGIPIILATAHNGNPSPGFSTHPAFSVNVNRSHAAALSQFIAVITRAEIEDSDYTEGFDFIAIGPP